MTHFVSTSKAKSQTVPFVLKTVGFEDNVDAGVVYPSKSRIVSDKYGE